MRTTRSTRSLVVAAAVAALVSACVERRDDDAWRAQLASWHAGEPWPDFPLVDDNGRSFSLHDVAGPVTVGFIYTRCPVDTMCPLTMRTLVAAHKQSGARVLVVTLDPERDTPAVLRDYRARFVGADDNAGDAGDRFVLATGARESVEALASLENVALVNGAHPTKIVHLDSRWVASVDGERP